MIIALWFLGIAWLIGDTIDTKWDGISSHAAAAEDAAKRAKAAREDEKDNRVEFQTHGQIADEQPAQQPALEVEEERSECLI